MKRRVRTIELIFEQKESLLIARRRKTVLSYCADCGRQTESVSPEAAAQKMGVNRRTIYRGIEAGSLGFSESPDGSIFVCIDCAETLSAPD